MAVRKILRNNEQKSRRKLQKAERTFYFGKAAERRKKQKKNQKRDSFGYFIPFGSLFILIILLFLYALNSPYFAL